MESKRAQKGQLDINEWNMIQKKISQVQTKVVEVPESSIQDGVRLGKYNSDKARSILVKLYL